MKKITPSNPYNPTGSDSIKGIIGEIPNWTSEAADKFKRHSQEIKELQEKITGLEKVNEVNASENAELKGEISELKEQIELLKEEIKKITEKQKEGELIAVIQQEQPPAYSNK